MKFQCFFNTLSWMLIFSTFWRLGVKMLDFGSAEELSWAQNGDQNRPSDAQGLLYAPLRAPCEGLEISFLTHFGCFWDPFWFLLPFGAFFVTFWSLLLPFGYFFQRFCFLLLVFLKQILNAFSFTAHASASHPHTIRRNSWLRAFSFLWPSAGILP